MFRNLKKIIKITALIMIVLVLSVLGTAYGIFFNEINALISIGEKGSNFYVMTYRNNYFFDEFLKRGASNDEELMLFLTEKVLHGVPVSLVLPEYGCTSFTAATTAGERLFARNYDWDDSPVMVLKTKPKNGYASLSVVDLSNLSLGMGEMSGKLTDRFVCLAAPYVPLDGMNEMGVAVSVNMLNGEPTVQNNGRTPITTTTLVRLVLDKAASVDEAIELVSQYELHDSAGSRFHFQVADKDGNSAVLEYENGELIVVRGSMDYQVMTNFILNDTGEPDTFGRDRYDTAKSRLLDCGGVLSAEDAMALLAEVKMDWTNSDDTTGGSVWSAVYHLLEGTMDLVVFRDYETIYTYSL